MTGSLPPSSALVRALGSLRVGVLALAAAQLAAFDPAVQARWRLLLIAAAHLPFARALALLYRAPAAASAASARRLLFACAMGTLCLMPFEVFWRDWPHVEFFAANALAAFAAELLLLVACTRLAGTVPPEGADASAARTAGCTIPLSAAALALALLAALAKTGLLSQPPEVLLPRLARLPRGVLLAGLLPHLSCAWALRRVRDGLIDRLSPPAP